MWLMDIILILLGVVSGLLSGLFGLGGGITVIPCLMLTLTYFGVPEDVLMHVAVGTSLSIMLANSVMTAMHHHRVSKINFGVVKLFLPTIGLGSILGGIFASKVSSNVLLCFFIIYLIYVILSKLIKYKKSRDITSLDKEKKIFVRLYGLMAGIISTMIGTGSSLMMMPFLIKRNFKIQQAVSITSVFNIFLATLGSLSYILLGWDHSLPKYSLGYVYLPASILIMLGGFVGVPWGVHILKCINENLAKTLYFLLIVFIFITMLIKLVLSMHLLRFM